MADVSKQWTDQIRRNYAMIQEILDNAKLFEDLDLLETLENESIFMIRHNGQSYKVTTEQILGKIVFKVENDTTPKLGGNLDADEKSINNLQSLQFKDGEQITWNADLKTLNIPTGLGNVLQVGQEVVFKVFNGSGVNILNGQVVYPNANSIGLADAHIKERSRLVAVATMDIPFNEWGYVTKLGQVGNLNTSAYSQGDVLYLSDNGSFSDVKPTGGSYIVVIGVVDVVHATEGVISVDTSSNELTVEVTDTNGFSRDQKDATVMGVINEFRSFSIQANSGDNFHFYENGDKYEMNATQSVTFDDLEGNHWMYFDKGILKTTYKPSQAEKIDIILNKCFIANIYWNATDKEVVVDIQDERHGISMTPETHLYLHLTRGAQWVSGYGLGDFTIGTGNDDVDAQFSVAGGLFFDEDITHEESGIGVGSSMYVSWLEGVDNIRAVPSQFPVLSAPSGRLYFNENVGGNWQRTEVGSGNFVLCHIFGFNGQTKNTVAVMGQNQYTTSSAAREGASNEISSLISAVDIDEIIPVGTVIYQTRDNYTNTVKARVIQYEAGVDYVDWRTTELAQGSNPSSHANLTNVEQAGAGITNGHISDGAQTIVGDKEFTGQTGAGYVKLKNIEPNGAVEIYSDGSGDVITLTETSIKVKSLNTSNFEKKLNFSGDGEAEYNINLPNASGTLALTSDIDEAIGDINSALDAINGEII